MPKSAYNSGKLLYNVLEHFFDEDLDLKKMDTPYYPSNYSAFMNQKAL